MSDPFGDDEDKEARGFLSGGTTPAQWPRDGYTVRGTVTGWSMRTQTDNDSGEALYWQGKALVKESDLKPTPKPREARQLLLEIQGPVIGHKWESNAYVEVPLPDDDGVRTIYAKSSVQKALSQALAKAKNLDGSAAVLEVGALVEITRGPDRKTPKGYRAHTHTAKWTPADQNADAAKGVLDDFSDEAAGTAQDQTPAAVGAAPADDPWA
jgi:hypothetical protein